MAIKSITPFLWFNTQAEDAAKFYASLFPNSKITNISYYGDGMPAPKGSVMVVNMELAGQVVTLLNGGPAYQLTTAFSFVVGCEDQAEIDRLWDALGEGGAIEQCGWLRDRWGLSWQIVPRQLGELMGDPAKAKRVTEAMLQMVKLDIAGLEAAAKG